MSFVAAIKHCLRNYVTFSGRAPRSEFWWWMLFVLILSMVSAAISYTATAIFALATLLPNIAVGARRLHDIDRTGWWQLIGLIPFGGLILLIFFCLRGNAGPNRFGENPLAAPAPTA